MVVGYFFLNMESRNITLTLDKAREWYNSSSAELREIALQAFTEEELKTIRYTDIKTFWDAVKALDLPNDSVLADLHNLMVLPFEACTKKHLSTIYKLDIIRKALNGDWDPSLVDDDIYYPLISFYPAGKKAKEIAARNDWKLGPTFMVDNEKYTLVGGHYDCYCYGGLAHFNCGFGVALPALGLLGCKSGEIAEHMSKYFSKEIFEACYSQHIGLYRWIL